MSEAFPNEIADFLKRGGKVAKLADATRVTGPEVFDYLVSCGFRIKLGPGEAGGYLYEGKRCSLAKLVDLANDYRRSQQLPPFATPVVFNIGGRHR